jgi:hypothetical protein
MDTETRYNFFNVTYTMTGNCPMDPLCLHRQGLCFLRPLRSGSGASTTGSGEGQSYLFRREDYRNKSYNPGKLSWDRVPVKIVSVARKQSTTEKRHQTPMTFALKRRLQEQNPQLRKTILDSSPGEDGSCLPKTKHEGRTAPRLNTFVSGRRLQEQRPQSRESVLDSSPSEDGFCSSESKYNNGTAPRPKFLFRRGD